MSLSDDLLRHALIGIISSKVHDDREVVLRRSVSSAYYALFHRIVGDAASTIAPNVSESVNYRIQRWFEHTELKQTCGRFLQTKLDQPLLGLIGTNPSNDLQFVARTFIELQSARHSADYDPGYRLSWDDAKAIVQSASKAIKDWEKIAQSEEANIFILSLLLWKKWDKERT